MKKITQDEAEGFEFVHPGRRGTSSTNPVVAEILKLEVGQGIHIFTDEWTLRSSPAVYLGQVTKRNNIKTSTRQLKDKSGWVIMRKA